MKKLKTKINWTIYEQFKLNLRKELLMFIYLANKFSSNIKQFKLKYTIVVMNKLHNMKLDLSIYNIICLYATMDTCIK